MFSSISWELFLTTTVAVIGGYYCITTLLLYHREIIQWIKSRKPQQIVKPSSGAAPTSRPAVMGNIHEESTHAFRSSIGSATEINFAASNEEPDAVNSPEASASEEHLLIGSLADLLQEIKTVSQLIADGKSDKAEGESLFRTLLVRYPHLRNSSYREAINFYILDVARHNISSDLSPTEINTWWEEERTSKK